MSYSPEDWKRVDEVLEAARLRLSPPLGWKEVALRAGLSAEGIRVIRRGLVDDPRPDNLAKIETALGLPLGTITSVLKGNEPELPTATATTESEPDTVAAIQADDRLTDEDKARLIALYEFMRDDDNGHGRGRHLA